MTDNVVGFGGETKLDMLADQVLDGAKAADLSTAIVVGYEPNGDLYFAGTTSDVEHILYLLEKAKQELMSWEVDDEQEPVN